ncbi:MAG: DUF3570 domain-containing protein [Chlorobi bacterium]|nr:DUF3570 domain-containing protein [Chlorobiota bacterium]
MKYIILIFFLLGTLSAFSQTKEESSSDYKKRVLESTELDILSSYYTQDGNNAAVTGGIGTEELNDFATNIKISIPLNDDDVLTIDGTISAYSSASSGNLNPFTSASSGASEGDDDEEDDDNTNTTDDPVTGSPWVASSGASAKDVWFNGIVGYSHSSDNRNNIINADIGFATEYDYSSFGGGLGFAHLMNEKNTELNISAKIYLDTWDPQYPTEIKTYISEDGNLDGGFFNGVDILDASGTPIDKNGTNIWSPVSNTLVTNKNRNTYSVSAAFSQILNKRAQISLFMDFVYQEGWLSNPMQRVYFSDRDNYYIGTASYIPVYDTPQNTEVFQLADDIERLPDSRVKLPLGMRFNYYLNEHIVVRTYYRYYFDDWGINSHTANIELPVKLGMNFTLYPSYRYYTQTAADYFAPFEQHLSSEQYYTSDYDLSGFSANQYGFGVQYNDLLGNFMGLKNVNLTYNYYDRTTGLDAHIVSFGLKFVIP